MGIKLKTCCIYQDKPQRWLYQMFLTHDISQGQGRDHCAGWFQVKFLVAVLQWVITIAQHSLHPCLVNPTSHLAFTFLLKHSALVIIFLLFYWKKYSKDSNLPTVPRIALLYLVEEYFLGWGWCPHLCALESTTIVYYDMRGKSVETDIPIAYTLWDSTSLKTFFDTPSSSLYF